jgi:chromosome segregation ATPase
MPVQDILANIQHAIDTGNINSAFVDTTGLEDDSERKSKVLEDYDIDESTLNTYTEQLKTTGELAEQHKELANSLEYAKKRFGEESDEAKNAREALTAFNGESEDMAVDLAQTQKGLESLSDNMAEYGDILKNGDKTTLEYAEALGAVKKALADTLNVSEENISNSLVENHLQDIEALAAGDEEALNRLRAAAGQDIAIGLYMSEDSNLTEGSLQLLEDKALELSSLDIEVGANVNDKQFVNALNNMMANGELTKDQVNEYLHSIGVEPHFETDTIDTYIFNTAGMYVRVPLP